MRALVTIAALLFLVPSVQFPAVQLPQAETTISLNVNIVNVLFTVSDRQGRLVLTQFPAKRHDDLLHQHELHTQEFFA